MIEKNAGKEWKSPARRIGAEDGSIHRIKRGGPASFLRWLLRAASGAEGREERNREWGKVARALEFQRRARRGEERVPKEFVGEVGAGRGFGRWFRL